METANKKLIIFDCDGVLNLEQTPGYKSVIINTLVKSNIPIDRTLLMEIMTNSWGNSPQDIAIEYVKEVQSKEVETHPEILDLVSDNYMEVLSRDFANIIQPVPGASEMLQRLKRRFSLALNTAADEEVLFKKVMPKLNIDPFDVFQGGMITALNLKDGKIKPKPEPDTTNALLKINGVEPEEAVMVGDSPADILTAYYAGVRDIVVPTTGMITPAEAALYHQEYGVEVVPDVTHLERLLGRAVIRMSLSGSN